MEEFFQELGFRIAGNLEVALVIGFLAGLAGIAVGVRALYDKEDLADHRFFVALCGFGLAALIAVVMPLLHRMAERTCDRWEASADTADQLSYLREGCADIF